MFELLCSGFQFFANPIQSRDYQNFRVGKDLVLTSQGISGPEMVSDWLEATQQVDAGMSYTQLAQLFPSYSWG